MPQPLIKMKINSKSDLRGFFNWRNSVCSGGSLISLKTIHELWSGIATCPDGLGFNKCRAIRLFAVKVISKGSIIAQNRVSWRNLGLVVSPIISCLFVNPKYIYLFAHVLGETRHKFVVLGRSGNRLRNESRVFFLFRYELLLKS